MRRLTTLFVLLIFSSVFAGPAGPIESSVYNPWISHIEPSKMERIQNGFLDEWKVMYGQERGDTIGKNIFSFCIGTGATVGFVYAKRILGKKYTYSTLLFLIGASAATEFLTYKHLIGENRYEEVGAHLARFFNDSASSALGGACGVAYCRLPKLDPIFQNVRETMAKEGIEPVPSPKKALESSSKVTSLQSFVAQRNRAFVTGREYRNELIQESMSGNAGSGRSAVVVVIDQSGVIQKAGADSFKDPLVSGHLKNGEWTEVYLLHEWKKVVVEGIPFLRGKIIKSGLHEASNAVNETAHIRIKTMAESLQSELADIEFSF